MTTSIDSRHPRLPKLAVWFAGVMIGLSLPGCASSARPIDEIFAPALETEFRAELPEPRPRQTDYRVGVLQVRVEAMPAEDWSFDDRRQQRLLDEIAVALTRDLIQVLQSEGVALDGPFRSQHEARGHLDILLQPELHLEFHPAISRRLESLPAHRDPDGGPPPYAQSRGDLSARLRLDLWILDAASRERLQRSVLRTGVIDKIWTQLWQRVSRSADPARFDPAVWRPLSLETHPGYHDRANVTAELLQEAYDDFSGRLAELVSARELALLGGERSAERLRRKAESELRGARFEAAQRTAERALALLDRFPETGRSLRAQLEVLAATCDVALGREVAALEHLRRALAADPELQMDPATTSPKVLRAFRTARADVAWRH